MPMRAKHQCNFPGCPELTNERYCEAHRKQMHTDYNQHRRDPRINARYDERWRRVRALYISAHPLCEECGKHGKLTPSQEVHHILPLADGGTHDETNLMALCKSCHSKITTGTWSKGGGR